MTAIRATFSDFKTIKTRKVAQLIFEVPIEQAMTALNSLGGVPQFDSEQWVGIAPIKAETPPEKPKKRFDEIPLSQQAGIMCNDERFWAFLKDRYPHKTYETSEDAAFYVRWMCGVDSRADLDSDSFGASHFRKIQTDFDVFTGRISGPR